MQILPRTPKMELKEFGLIVYLIIILGVVIIIKIVDYYMSKGIELPPYEKLEELRGIMKEIEEPKYCEFCGTQQMPYSSYCPYCGKGMKSELE